MFTTRQKVTLISSPHPGNIIPSELLPNKGPRYHKAITQIIKQSAGLATNIAACKLWMKVKDGG
jgi:hypothetical protein